MYKRRNKVKSFLLLTKLKAGLTGIGAKWVEGQNNYFFASKVQFLLTVEW